MFLYETLFCQFNGFNLFFYFLVFVWLHKCSFLKKKGLGVTSMSYTLSVDISYQILFLFSSLTAVIKKKNLLENKVNYDK